MSNAEEARSRGIPVLRIGVLNVMPKAESYEPYLLRPLAHAEVLVEPVWIRLESHHYSSSNAAHIQQHYRTFAQARAEGALSGLILSGAPVEELAFEAVHYWSELCSILEFARQQPQEHTGLVLGRSGARENAGLGQSPVRKEAVRGVSDP